MATATIHASCHVECVTAGCFSTSESTVAEPACAEIIVPMEPSFRSQADGHESLDDVVQSSDSPKVLIKAEECTEICHEVSDRIDLAELEKRVACALVEPPFNLRGTRMPERMRLQWTLEKVRTVNKLAKQVTGSPCTGRVRSVWWRSLRGRSVPRWPPNRDPNIKLSALPPATVLDVEGVLESWLEQCDDFGLLGKRCFALELVSHRWLRAHFCSLCAAGEFCPLAATASPDDNDIKARALAEYGEVFGDRLGTHDKFFWVDFAGIDQDDPFGKAVGITLLPLYVATCQRVIFLDDKEYEARSWTRLERLLGAAFCDERSFLRIVYNGNLKSLRSVYRDGRALGINGSWRSAIYMHLADPCDANVTNPSDLEVIGRLKNVVSEHAPNLWKGGWIRVDQTFMLGQLVLTRSIPMALPCPSDLNVVPGQSQEESAPVFRRSFSMEHASKLKNLRQQWNGIVPSRPNEDELTIWDGMHIWMLLVVALAVYAGWLVLSVQATCDNLERHCFNWYVLVHSGIWFFLSLAGMSAMYNILLSDQAEPWKALKCAFVGGSLGLASGWVGLYIWHIRGNKIYPTFTDVLVSKVLVMMCVGIFGMMLFTVVFIRDNYLDGGGERWKGFISYMKGEGLHPVIMAIMWCVVWMTAEVFAQAFDPCVTLAGELLPGQAVPLAEAAYLCLWSFITLPQMRRFVGMLERHFLPDACDDDEESYFHVLRAICWSDLLFDGFRWQYNRIVFLRLSPVAFALVVLRDFFSAMYNFGWKCCPELMILKLAYLGGGSPVPALSTTRLPKLVYWLCEALKLLTVADAADAGIFNSTRFTVDLGSGRIIFKTWRRAAMELDQQKSSSESREATDPWTHSVIATFAVLNQKFDVSCKKVSRSPGNCMRGSITETAFTKVQSPRGKLTLNTFKEALRMTLDEVDGRLRCHVVQPILQVTTLRFRIRYLSKIASSGTLLITMLILSLTRVRTIQGILVETEETGDSLSLGLSFVYPVVMLFFDITECVLLLKVQCRWLLAADLGRYMCRAVLETPLFCVALLCMIWHTSMSPVLSQHSLKFC